MHQCVDCLALPPSKRPPKARKTNGKPLKPRCWTHEKAEEERVKAANQARNWQKKYGLSGEDYARLYEFQGGKCAICQRATGAAKALAVDHDHDCCPGPLSCGDCTRGLLCSNCNRFLLGRYSSEALVRALRYLSDPPMRRFRQGRPL